MAIYIKGVEMPKSCEECRMSEAHYGTDDWFCHAANRWFDDPWFVWYEYEEGDIDTSKPLNCPLTEVPEPHGRSIDENSLMKYFNVYKYEEWTSKEVSGLINNAPTVIEGSE